MVVVGVTTSSAVAATAATNPGIGGGASIVRKKKRSKQPSASTFTIVSLLCVLVSTLGLVSAFVFLVNVGMASRDPYPPGGGSDGSSNNNQEHQEYTTNEYDRQEAARLKAELSASNQAAQKGQLGGPGRKKKVPNVQIANGRYKYVQITAVNPDDGTYETFVTSKKGAHYHRNAAEPVVRQLQDAGYHDIDIKGGGRIFCDDIGHTMEIYGYSYSFGQANHAISMSVVKKDPKYADYHITISNEGY